MNTQRKIAISDIHGCARTFRTLIEDKVHLKLSDELYLLGDYIDRGPDSKGVIDYILRLKALGHTVHCLKGNHEDMMIAGIHNLQTRRNWMTHGGHTTMDSFDADTLQDIPQKYWNFLDSLEYYRTVDQYILVHAGLNFDAIDPLKDTQSMMWVRWWEDKVNWDWLGDRVIVHGHTPTEMQEIIYSLKYTIDVQIIDIDAGCYAIHETGMGNLCALDLTHKKIYFCPNLDMERRS